MCREERMRGKRVLVTGSGTGIGREVALEFARHGASVVLHYSTSAAGAQTAVEEIRGLGSKTEAFHADFADLDQVFSMAQEAIDYLGGIDILVNNAGLTTNMPIDEVRPKHWDLLYHINVRGLYFVTQAVVGPMVEQGSGVIINVASVHAIRGMQEHSIYAGTKAAIVGFTQALAVELAPKGIRVNAIAPGAIEVPNYYRNIPGFDREAFAKNLPVGFIGEPIDIARIAVFLASEGARYILGQTIVADGGQTCYLALDDGFRKPLGFTWAHKYTPGLQ